MYFGMKSYLKSNRNQPNMLLESHFDPIQMSINKDEYQ
jgi:hypothetical protein